MKSIYALATLVAEDKKVLAAYDIEDKECFRHDRGVIIISLSRL